MPSIYAGNMRSSILTEAGGHTMRIAADFKVEEWLGIIGIHELSHVYDMQYLGENSFNPNEYLLGEVTAHKLERDLLRNWNPEAFNLLVEYGYPMLENGRMNDFFNLAERIYPLSSDLLSPRERGLALASVQISVVFEAMERSGASDTQLGQAYERVARGATH